MKITYRYECKCGKEPTRGFIRSTRANCRPGIELVERAWQEQHNTPQCIPIEQARKLAESAR